MQVSLYFNNLFNKNCYLPLVIYLGKNICIVKSFAKMKQQLWTFQVSDYEREKNNTVSLPSLSTRLSIT